MNTHSRIVREKVVMKHVIQSYPISRLVPATTFEQPLNVELLVTHMVFCWMYGPLGNDFGYAGKIPLPSVSTLLTERSSPL